MTIHHRAESIFARIVNSRVASARVSADGVIPGGLRNHVRRNPRHARIFPAAPNHRSITRSIPAFRKNPKTPPVPVPGRLLLGATILN